MTIVNFETQTVTKNRKLIIDHGKPINGFEIRNDPVTFEELEILYEKYKHSVPNGVKYKKTYFKALNAENLSVEDLINGENRQSAKELLELTLLMGVLNHSLIWPDDTKWFWQSEKDKDFVILKKWIKS
jgi:arsenate reductase-like glutaredoxin family protein